MAEERIGKYEGSRSFSLPHLHNDSKSHAKKYTDISGIHGSSLDQSKDQSLMFLSKSLSKGNIQKIRQEAESELLDLEGKKQQPTLHKYKSLKSLNPGSTSKILPMRHLYER
mmetsp:Transcript_43367/g.41788  ORF Transcript_43367/g.41788 Transcript_43367/m.41788 type:complete len:112 (+) Transcript_43367:970-1305(+)